MTTYSVTQYGATGDGKTPDTQAVQAAIDAAHTHGGGTVVIPGGTTCLIGTIELKSNITLHLEPGSALIASHNREDFQNAPSAGEYGGSHSAFLIVAYDATNIAITGTGEINGSGIAYMDGWQTGYEPYIRQPKPWRPRLIGCYGCHSLTFRDITLRDSASWCLHLTGCQDVLINGIRILNDLTIPNCDGIDPDHCCNVRISDCYIQAGDDCIVLKTTQKGRELGYDGCSDITITNCTLISTSAAIKIGTESQSDFRNITVNNCIIKSSSRGLAIQLRDGGHVENVLFSNCIVETRLFHHRWWGQAEPIYVTSLPRNASTTVGRIKNVRFDQIVCRSENGAFISGTEVDGQKTIENVTLNNVRIEIDKWSKWPGGKHDKRPSDGQEHGGLHDALIHGVFVECAKNIQLHQIDILWGSNRQAYWGEDIITKNVENMSTA